LKPALCVRRVRFVMVSPDPRQNHRCQARNPVIGLSEFPRPPLSDKAFAIVAGPPPSRHRESDHARVGQALSRIGLRRSCSSIALTPLEKSVIKALLNDGWRNQDIQTLINTGRASSVNLGAYLV